MSSKVVHTQVEGRKLKLTNLSKIIYPELSIPKAEIIQYFLGMAEHMIPFIKERPMTLIRYPDGVTAHQFYSKTRPDYAPDWMESFQITHDNRSIDYIYIKSAAGLAWTANLAALELHPMAFRVGQPGLPDYMVFDLDPDEQISFKDVVMAAERLRSVIDAQGYTTYLKTSGGKGLHLMVPLKPEHTFEEVKERCKTIAQMLIAKYPNAYTLEISKSKRKGKILIDIYRNHETNTVVAPYSLRGKVGAPISMPIPWERLATLESSQEININNYKDHLPAAVAAWQDWDDMAVPLVVESTLEAATSPQEVDQRLKDYVEKRDLNTTPEPMALVRANYKDRYSIQFHNASNLHYDLRLEDQGVLWSWAIPKGPPVDKGQKRLAIRTEDHPIEYLTFEGVIPEGAYGAGEMWTIETGTTIWHTKEKNKLVFSLGQHKYHLVKTKREDQWLMTLSDDKPFLNKGSSLKPMLADQRTDIPSNSNYVYEVKWDGIRVLIYLNEDEVHIKSRSGRDMTQQFPELLDPKLFNVEYGIFDGEIVVLDDQGRPVFADVISRMHSKGGAIKKAQKQVSCYLFDVLSIDGFDTIDEPLTRRRALLKPCLKWGEAYRYSNSFEDGAGLFAAIQAKTMEGIMAKTKDGRYHIGARTKDWYKIKSRTEMEATIVGYTEGKGDRSGLFGSLHLMDADENYIGKVGTGFDYNLLKEITTLLKAQNTMVPPEDIKIDEADRTIWIESDIRCLVKYASMTPNGTLREPVFIKIITT